MSFDNREHEVRVSTLCQAPPHIAAYSRTQVLLVVWRVMLVLTVSGIVTNSVAQQEANTPVREIVKPDWDAATPSMPNLLALDGSYNLAGINIKGTSMGSILGHLSQQGVANIQLPILLPAEEALLKTVKLAGTAYEYSASIELNGASVDVIGTRVAFRLPANTSTLPTASVDSPRAGKTETGRALSFTRFNVAYRLEVNCARPSVDKRCTNENFIQSLFSNLRVLGGTAEPKQ